MIRHLAGLLAAALFCATGALAEAPPTNAPGMPVGTGLQPTAVYDATGKLVDPSPGTKTTSGALQPPTAASGKIVDTSVALTANTSTTLVAARGTPGDRIAAEIQCDGTAVVGIDMKGGTLTSATAAPRVIPSGSYPLYTPPIATQTAITAYTGTAQTCRVTEYLR
ncbi:hypothetical protein SAMN02799631_04340 [Methylobacterium sp. 174MFSha1.1]|uniref:hypothetical protein n=1 Tax=Methylobacterium sp. 174MFSha1.1 TaxID=1502749 RepID=UPI0008F34ED4|nr:hypothetical protein [Methylobacterium sp. 174MFSha1.1]SFV06033.1 hypothetical protein SAMN02799631_04340 [Methylobacterium sp. 174MFSha1.1]